MDDYGARLADVAHGTLAGWMSRLLEGRLRSAGIDPGGWRAGIDDASELVRDRVLGQLRRLLETDIDEQRTNPLAIVRANVGPGTELLRRAGVPELRREPFEERAFPDDVFALGPASWADVDDALVEPGLVWGAWKAKQHLGRHRAGGLS
jgi:hypothetical protein